MDYFLSSYLDKEEFRMLLPRYMSLVSKSAGAQLGGRQGEASPALNLVQRFVS